MHWIASVDRLLTLKAEQYLGTGWLNTLFACFTYLGNGAILWVGIALICLFNKRWRPAGIAILAALALSSIVVDLLLKNLIQRIRPFDEIPTLTVIVRLPRSYSFPSGHSTSSFAAVSALIPRLRNPWVKGGLLLLAGLIAASRFLLRVHYLTDILAGLIIGILCGVAAHMSVSRIYARH